MNIVGRTYQDPEGIWEVTGTCGQLVEIRQVQEDNLNFGFESVVTMEEAMYYLGLSEEPREDDEWEEEAAQIISDDGYEEAVDMMDDDLREELHCEIAPCTDLTFLKAYMARHYERYGVRFMTA